MNIHCPAAIGHVKVELEANEALHVLHPQSIAAFQGNPRNREDRFMDLGGAYRKKRWTRSRLQGPAQFLLGLPPGFTLEMVDIPEEGSLLFDYRHIMLFSDGMTFKSKILKWRTAWITRELVRIKFNGPGVLGVLSVGDIATIQLLPEEPLFVDKSALVAYPEDAEIKLSVYGNTLASQHMNVQWELRGRGPVLIQTGARDTGLQDKLTDDGWIKRVLREVLPFGSVYIK
ncbi:AIM24 family protein [Paenibacillus sp. J5C_2022]|uniref:AIM24 family protein n=1 Tax=Paenibacillus sp. J5C2022 TaxID=2977129 RepID=UPI0021CE7172|nr:AIM24 family protein [Paenibacillus sp. J5C2022]MCU6708584.1 AIM24 family protein [Paenibacillus sp. J5C2022]